MLVPGRAWIVPLRGPTTQVRTLFFVHVTCMEDGSCTEQGCTEQEDWYLAIIKLDVPGCTVSNEN